MGISGQLNQSLRTFIERQPIFFVATAAADGTVNLSPKGMDALRILNDTSLVWLNLSGSGNETAAHIRVLNRMTLMFCAFSRDALILRLYGEARVIHPRDSDWAVHAERFPDYAGARQIFVMQIVKVQTSCGTGVPFMKFQSQRGEKELVPWYADMKPEGVREYWARKNTQSIDGKPTGILDP